MVLFMAQIIHVIIRRIQITSEHIFRWNENKRVEIKIHCDVCDLHLPAIQCEYGYVYKPCGSPCEQTCRNIGADPEAYCHSTHCMEGCYCPDGMVENGKRGFSVYLPRTLLKRAETDAMYFLKKHKPMSRLTPCLKTYKRRYIHIFLLHGM